MEGGAPVVVLVGASSGIGAELARRYAARAAKFPVRLVLAARRVAQLEAVAAQCCVGGGGDGALAAEAVRCVPTDATLPGALEALMDATVATFGRVDVVYYIVGQAMHVKFMDITEVETVARAMMNTNFHGAVWTAAAAGPHLRASHGVLVVVSSVAGELAPPYLSFYAAGKHALHGFVESLRNEEPGYDVCVVCPGYVATEIDDKKMLGDGSVRSVELNVDKAKYMPAKDAADLIVGAVDKRKPLFHLTSSGRVAGTLHGLFPGLINSAVRKEMKKITGEAQQQQ